MLGPVGDLLRPHQGNRGTFEWLHLYKRWGRINLLSDSTTVGGSMSISAGCYRTFFQLAKQATRKLASSLQNPYQMVETWTALWRCALCSYALLLVQIRCTLPHALIGFLLFSRLSSSNLCCLSSESKTPWGLSIMGRLLKSVRLRLRRINSGANRIPFAFSGCVSSTLRNSI